MALYPPPKGFAPTSPISRAPGNPAAKIGPKVKVAPPLTDFQVAQRQVAAAYDPVIQQITAAYNARGTAMGNAINQQTGTLAQLYGQYGPQSQAAYDKAAQSMAAVNAALGATQQAQGGGLQADLGRQLQGIDAGTVGRVGATLASNLAGESLANATKGSNNLAMLLAEGAHAGDYGAKLPGIAGGIGLRTQEQTQGQITNDLRTALDQLASKEPGAVQDALANIQAARYKQQEFNLLQWYKQQVIGQKNAAVARPDPSLSRAYGYPVDANGNPIGGTVTPLPGYTVGPGGNVIRTPKSASNRPPSASTTKTLNSLASALYNGVPPKREYHIVTNPDGSKAGQWLAVPGTGSPPVTWGAAIARMIAAGAGTPANAVKLLTAQGWRPGEGGRPDTAAHQQAVRGAKAALGRLTKHGIFGGR